MGFRATQDQAEAVRELAESKPQGITRGECERRFGWTGPRFFAAVRRSRVENADEERNLVALPRGQSEQWLYRLVSCLDDAQPWTRNRLGDLKSRLKTGVAMSQSLVAATDGRSLEGREVRKIEHTLSYLMQELADMQEAVFDHVLS